MILHHDDLRVLDGFGSNLHLWLIPAQRPKLNQDKGTEKGILQLNIPKPVFQQCVNFIHCDILVSSSSITNFQKIFKQSDFTFLLQ
jgi:hypothetical protein